MTRGNGKNEREQMKVQGKVQVQGQVQVEASGGGGWSRQPGCEVCWYSGDCTSARNLPFNWASLAVGLTLNWSESAPAASLPSSLAILANINV